MLCFSKPSANMTPCAKKPVKLQFPCSYSNVHDPQPLWLMQTHIHVHINSMAWVTEIGVMGSITGPCHPSGTVCRCGTGLSPLPKAHEHCALPFHSPSPKVPLTSGFFSLFFPHHTSFPLWFGVFFSCVFAALAPTGALQLLLSSFGCPGG